MRTGPALLALSVACALAACGSRTGILLVEEPGEAGEDAAPDVTEEAAPPEASPEPTLEAGPDVVDATVHDVREEPDAREEDAPGRDAREEDARVKDVLPPIDVTPPVDVSSDCPDAGSTYIYVITEANDLLAFYPPTATFHTIGKIACPGSGSPFSMAVDSTGVAYVEFSTGDLYRVSTLTAACVKTPFQPGQSGFNTFGMAFTHDQGRGETLFVAADISPPKLGSIAIPSFVLTDVGAFHPTIGESELTGTGGGELFGFYARAPGTAIGQIDKATAQVVGESPLPTVSLGNGWAFAFWGGDFYTFTAPSTTVVNRYRPSDGSVVQVASLGEVVVGAGVSTCAPQQ